jgi:hypothetical protein
MVVNENVYLFIYEMSSINILAYVFFFKKKEKILLSLLCSLISKDIVVK